MQCHFMARPAKVLLQPETKLTTFREPPETIPAEVAALNQDLQLPLIGKSNWIHSRSFLAIS